MKRGGFYVSRYERVTGVEPVPKPWKSFVLPLYYTRSRGAGIRTRAKSSQRTRATVTLHPVSDNSNRENPVSQSRITMI